MMALWPEWLRPLWLLPLPLLAWLLWRLWHRERASGRWQLLLPAAFHQVLLKGGDGRSSRLPWVALGLAWLLAIGALLGPSWQRVEQSNQKPADPLLVVLELTPQMLASDGHPNRLEQARRKGDLNRMAELQYGVIPDLERSQQMAEQHTKPENQLLRNKVTDEEIAEVVSKWTGIPVSKMLEGERDKLLRMEDALHKRVIGQGGAVSAISRALRRARVRRTVTGNRLESKALQRHVHARIRMRKHRQHEHIYEPTLLVLRGMYLQDLDQQKIYHLR